MEGNEVKIRGIVDDVPAFDHSCGGEDFYEITVLFTRLSDTVDEIPVIISERLIDIQKIVPDMPIEVIGEIRTHNYMAVDGNRSLRVYLFARKIDASLESGPDINEVRITGYLCKCSESRETPKGRTICDFIIAYNRMHGKSDYIPCITWSRNANYVERIPIGSKIEISGRFQSREYLKRYDDADIVKKTAYEVSVSDIKVIEERATSEDENS